MSVKDKDDLRAIYDAQWRAYLYQDSLRWSRFKIIATVEAGLIYVVFLHDAKIHAGWVVLLVFAASLLVWIIVQLARKDEVDTGLHVRAMARLESDMWPEWGAAIRGEGGFAEGDDLGKYVKEWREYRPKGATIMRWSSLLILGFNALLLVRSIWMVLH